MLFGVEVSPRRQQDETALNAFLSYIEVLEFPEKASSHYAQIRTHLKKLWTMIGGNEFVDCSTRSKFGINTGHAQYARVWTGSQIRD